MEIRKGKKEDLPQVMDLVMELAIYEKCPDQVVNTVAQMEKDGFGENPVYGLLVADDGGQIVGISIYYYRYSTWKGKRIWLEDLIVTESKRGSGIGKQLFDATIEIGKQTACTGMMWQVLDWNEPAINFYKKYFNASMETEWNNCHIDF
ncbi:MAG: GNAT family N-acetyltransferase [Cyclobacteriaceae bacterium]